MGPTPRFLSSAWYLNGFVESGTVPPLCIAAFLSFVLRCWDVRFRKLTCRRTSGAFDTFIRLHDQQHRRRAAHGSAVGVCVVFDRKSPVQSSSNCECVLPWSIAATSWTVLALPCGLLRLRTEHRVVYLYFFGFVFSSSGEHFVLFGTFVVFVAV